MLDIFGGIDGNSLIHNDSLSFTQQMKKRKSCLSLIAGSGNLDLP